MKVIYALLEVVGDNYLVNWPDVWVWSPYKMAKTVIYWLRADVVVIITEHEEPVHVGVAA